MTQRIGRAVRLLLVLPPLVVSCGGADDATIDRGEAITVRVAVVESDRRAVPYEALGTIRAEDHVVVAARVLSQIGAVDVDVGDEVDVGQVLVRLDDREVMSGLRQAEAAQAEVDDAIQEAGHALEMALARRELARTTYKRFAALYEKRSVSAQEYEEMSARLQGEEAAVRVAEARQRQAESRRIQVEGRVESAQVMAGYTLITSPIAGVVTARHVDAGSLAAPGVPLLTLEPLGALELEVFAPSALLGAVSIGQSADAVVDGTSGADGPVTLRGEIFEIAPTVDAASHTFTVAVRLPADDRLRSGMFARAILPGPMRDVLSVPVGAVIERGQLQSVFVVENDVAERRLVSLGGVVDGQYEVLAGLVAGERVVMAPEDLTDGQLVVVSE